jgi:transcriptional regulator with XRE-family HTH domain
MAPSPHAADIYAGSKLRLQRQVRGISQTVLADALGITFQQVQKYEKGVNRISASRLQHIAKILGVPVSFFFRDDDAQPPRSDQQPSSADDGISAFLFSKQGLSLNRSFLAISDAEKRKAVVDLVEALADMKL